MEADYLPGELFDETTWSAVFPPPLLGLKALAVLMDQTRPSPSSNPRALGVKPRLVHFGRGYGGVLAPGVNVVTTIDGADIDKLYIQLADVVVNSTSSDQPPTYEAMAIEMYDILFTFFLENEASRYRGNESKVTRAMYSIAQQILPTNGNGVFDDTYGDLVDSIFREKGYSFDTYFGYCNPNSPLIKMLETGANARVVLEPHQFSVMAGLWNIKNQESIAAALWDIKPDAWNDENGVETAHIFRRHICNGKNLSRAMVSKIDGSLIKKRTIIQAILDATHSDDHDAMMNVPFVQFRGSRIKSFINVSANKLSSQGSRVRTLDLKLITGKEEHKGIPLPGFGFEMPISARQGTAFVKYRSRQATSMEEDNMISDVVSLSKKNSDYFLLDYYKLVYRRLKKTLWYEKSYLGAAGLSEKENYLVVSILGDIEREDDAALKHREPTSQNLYQEAIAAPVPLEIESNENESVSSAVQIQSVQPSLIQTQAVQDQTIDIAVGAPTDSRQLSERLVLFLIQNGGGQITQEYLTKIIEKVDPSLHKTYQSVMSYIYREEIKRMGYDISIFKGKPTEEIKLARDEAYNRKFLKRVIEMHGGLWSNFERSSVPIIMDTLAKAGVQLQSLARNQDEIPPAHPTFAELGGVISTVRPVSTAPVISQTITVNQGLTHKTDPYTDEGIAGWILATKTMDLPAVQQVYAEGSRGGLLKLVDRIYETYSSPENKQILDSLWANSQRK